MSLHVEQTPATAEANPYLEGPYAATHDEVTLHGLEVLAGEIPDDLNGVYVRNGPNPQHHPVGRYHWFDGDGMVHSVHFADGAATYRNRWVRTEGFLAERDAGTRDLARHHRAVRREPAGRAREGHRQHRPRVPPRPAARALVPRGQAVRARPGDARDARPATTSAGRCAARCRRTPRWTSATGELMFFDFGVKPPYMRYGVVGPEGTVRHFVPIDLPGPRLPHDMAITERHSILMDLPLVADPEAARARPPQARLRARPAGALRRDPALRRRRGDPLVRGRPLLHLPLGQRARRGRRGRARRVPRASSPSRSPRTRARSRRC